MKICAKCKVEKPNNSFGVNNSFADLKQRACKACLSSQRKIARAKNPDIYKNQWKRNKYSSPEASENRRLLAAYGITTAMKETYLNMVGGRCEICSISIKLVVDHNHATGGFRGLLCNKCNVGLGHFNDDIKLLRKAVDYIYGKS
jgi:hypothetical protein